MHLQLSPNSLKQPLNCLFSKILWEPVYKCNSLDKICSVCSTNSDLFSGPQRVHCPDSVHYDFKFRGRKRHQRKSKDWSNHHQIQHLNVFISTKTFSLKRSKKWWTWVISASSLSSFSLRLSVRPSFSPPVGTSAQPWHRHGNKA